MSFDVPWLHSEVHHFSSIELPDHCDVGSTAICVASNRQLSISGCFERGCNMLGLASLYWGNADQPAGYCHFVRLELVFHAAEYALDSRPHQGSVKVGI
jgi:hypothetical protein